MNRLPPLLARPGVVVRPGLPDEAEVLRQILAEPSVARWWGAPEPTGELIAELSGEADTVVLVVEADGVIAGGIQYWEEDDPRYRHAGIDIYLSGRCQGRGVGVAAIRLLARYLFEQRQHHRLTIDPAAANTRAIRCYAKAGFRPVGVLRQYEAGADGTFHDGLLMDLLADELR